ncbi:TPA: hypothetical protein ACGU7J_002241 [Vibrio vulnificus]
MMSVNHYIVIKIPTIIMLLSLQGCVSNDVQQQYEDVAKNWNFMVRASQVTPVYPLQEDLRPGDIFVTPLTMDSEIDSWRGDGYLTLNNVYARINLTPQDYSAHYQGATSSQGLSMSQPPTAAFPTYSFSFDKRLGGGLALPVSSVPVALSAAGAGAATGTVAFKDTYSIGLPDSVIHQKLQAWNNAEMQKQLSAYTKNEDERLYVLRVITRTFSVKSVSVSLSFTETSAGNIQAGAPPTVPELWAADPEEYKQVINYLNQQIALKTDAGQEPEAPQDDSEEEVTDQTLSELKKQLEVVKKLKEKSQLDAIKRHIERVAQTDEFGGYLLPGASVKFSSFSQNGAAMQETFSKPLVFGYWANEYVVTRSGQLLHINRARSLVENSKAYKAMLKTIHEIPSPEKPNEKP